MTGYAQKTICKPVTINGIGLHSGRYTHMTLRPAEADTGIVFIRTDVKDDRVIPARWDHVVDTRLCTVVGNTDGASVGTIEHLMSALCGCGIDNVTIEIDGPEVPVMDGSAMPFVEAIDSIGIKTLSAPRRAIRVLREVSLEQDGKRVSLKPAPMSIYSGEIEFDHAEIGRQTFSTSLLNGNFRHDIAQARTFGFLHEVNYLRTQGLALGGSMDNAIVLGDDKVMNPGGLRFADEFIRHKLLDAIGDLYLAGGPILGAYYGVKAGHALNNRILHELFSSRENWTITDMTIPAEQTGASRTPAGSESLLVA
ncbi:MAG: UDP-3-O-acyl-N-acetylglucosamine deacetylase [Alphaproteobacteria bacterium]|nr:UDP-3-O-acyl-N-acetylglucosamine deacetylase [Alphaproteobacteria bacterium]MCB9974271.1 UDP-3-O-acyl-N-acetylglucosamine deacetylase [Rhodospirillales bacterium]